MAPKKKDRWVVITTEFRGVFFGLVTDDSKTPERIELSNARHCVYWDRSTHGVLGLAATGPGSQCRIGPEVPLFTAWKITSVTECTPQAVEAWKKSPWIS